MKKLSNLLLFSILLTISNLHAQQILLIHQELKVHQISSLDVAMQNINTSEVPILYLTYLDSANNPDTLFIQNYNFYGFNSVLLNLSVSFITPQVGFYDFHFVNNSNGHLILKNQLYGSHKPLFFGNEDKEYQILNSDDSLLELSFTFPTYLDLNFSNCNTFDAQLLKNNQWYQPDSVKITSNNSFTFFMAQAPDSAGFYNLVVHNDIDTSLFLSDYVFINNPDFLQIDSISPDSFDNITWIPNNPNNPMQIIFTIYGNQTHFTDSNTITFLNPEPLGIIDSLICINDSTLLLYFTNFMACKQIIIPTKLSICNPQDGLLEYPLIYVFYGATPEQNSTRQWEAYPNPAQNLLHLKTTHLNTSGPIELDIYDLQGKKVASQKHQSSSEILINTNNLISGSYIIIIKSNNQQEFIKFIKQ
jgi:hypothetical protein